MKNLLYIFVIMTCINCKNKSLNHISVTNSQQLRSFSARNIQVIEASFPIYLSKINFKNPALHNIPDNINKRIYQIVLDYYLIDCMGDHGETFFSIKDTYFNTLKIPYHKYDFYLIILKHAPGNLINSKLLCFDNCSKKFINPLIDFNIHGLYIISGSELKPSNLKVLFKIKGPELEIMDNKNDGKIELKLTRLNHNGTFNSLEIMKIQIKNNTFDILNVKKIMI